MKQTLLRFGILTGVVVLGLIAIAQAQREGAPTAAAANPPASQKAPPASTGTSASSLPVSRPRPQNPAIAPTDPEAEPLPAERPVRDPFAGIRRASEAASKPAAPAALPASSAAAKAPASRLRVQVDPAEQAESADSGVPPRGSLGAADRNALPVRYGNRPEEGRPQRFQPGSIRPVSNEAASEPAMAIESGGAGAEPAEEPAEGRRYSPSEAAEITTSQPRRPYYDRRDEERSGAEEPRYPARERSATSDPFESNGPARIAPERAIPERGGFDNAITDAPRSGDRDIRRPMGGEGSGTPGPQQLEGQQSPSLSVHKLAPREMRVGQPATIEIVVRNTGSVAAHRVELRDQIPKGTRFLDARPAPRQDAQGELSWALHTLEPAAEAKVELRLAPLVEGEVGSVATVSFSADASARSTVTRPQLAVDVQAPSKVMIQDEIRVVVKVTNPGSGAATGVVLRDLIPAGFEHAAGPELEYDVGELAPGDSRSLDLTLKAVKPGKFTNVLEASGDGELRAKPARNEIEVVAPAIEVAVAGPKRRYLERPATYTLSVSNPGSASAHRVELVATLPPGLEFSEADHAGRYESQTRTVHWLLDELPAERTGNVSITAVPHQAGQHELSVTATADGGLSAKATQEVAVEGVAAVLFQLADVADPIEVGGETAYEVRVVNQGSKAAENVRIVAIVPEQLEAVSAEGPTRHSISGQRIVFEPAPRLAPKADMTYRVRVRGAAAGDVRFRVQLITDEMKSPVTKEESTQIFADE